MFVFSEFASIMVATWDLWENRDIQAIYDPFLPECSIICDDAAKKFRFMFYKAHVTDKMSRRSSFKLQRFSQQAYDCVYC